MVAHCFLIDLLFVVVSVKPTTLITVLFYILVAEVRPYSRLHLPPNLIVGITMALSTAISPDSVPHVDPLPDLYGVWVLCSCPYQARLLLSFYICGLNRICEKSLCSVFMTRPIRFPWFTWQTTVLSFYLVLKQTKMIYNHIRHSLREPEVKFHIRAQNILHSCTTVEVVMMKILMFLKV